LTESGPAGPQIGNAALKIVLLVFGIELVIGALIWLAFQFVGGGT
jgi:hypothetical protein